MFEYRVTLTLCKFICDSKYNFSQCVAPMELLVPTANLATEDLCYHAKAMESVM
jgi:hypothetical protein